MSILTHSLLIKSLALGLALSLVGADAHARDIDPNICGVGGVIAGAAIGNQFGGGDGKVAMTILGAVLGGAAGHRYCKAANNSEDIRNARENEHRLLTENRRDFEWSNPRYGRGNNSHSRVEQRGYYGRNQCTMTRSVMRDRGGSYVNETYWCQEGGRWSQVTETTTISEIRWGANGPVETTTTTVTTGRPGRHTGGPMIHPSQPVPRGIISPNRLARFEDDVRRDWAHPERVTEAYASEFRRSGEMLSLDQLGVILAATKFDPDRQQMLRTLLPVVNTQYGSMIEALRSFVHDSNRQEARRMLSPVRRDEYDSRDHDRRRDREDRDHGRPGRRW